MTYCIVWISTFTRHGVNETNIRVESKYLLLHTKVSGLVGISRAGILLIPSPTDARSKRDGARGGPPAQSVEVPSKTAGRVRHGQFEGTGDGHNVERFVGLNKYIQNRFMRKIDLETEGIA